MSEAPPTPDQPLARSFGHVADAYDRARPGYPDEAATWLVGRAHTHQPATVLELGAGTGKLTEVLVRAGHRVLPTDPLPEMLARLADRVSVQPVVTTAERLPLPSRSVDVVVCGQSFHWFDHDLALPEIARVLRPGGFLALAWNYYDVGIPWVKRLRDLIAPAMGTPEEAVMPLLETPCFGFVDKQQFRFWQPHTAASLADLARSVSWVSQLGESDRSHVLEKVAELYEGYGRGHDGMQVPYLTHCYRAVVRHDALAPEEPIDFTPRAEGDQEGESDTEHTGPIVPTEKRPPEDPGMQLIDFR